MKTDFLIPALLSLSLVSARPLGVQKREVPQEHSHNQFLDTVRTSLDLNNPAGIVDPVFGLLGDAVSVSSLQSVESYSKYFSRRLQAELVRSPMSSVSSKQQPIKLLRTQRLQRMLQE